MTWVLLTRTLSMLRGVQPHWMTGPFSFFQMTVLSMATSLSLFQPLADGDQLG
jgi:hypothetical protein